MMEWKQILEGWRNHLFPPSELKKLIRQTQEDRLNICLNCPFNSTKGRINMFSKCNDCGCPLKQKTACLHCKCPQDKWLPIAEKEQSEAINEYIKTKDNEPNNT